MKKDLSGRNTLNVKTCSRRLESRNGTFVSLLISSSLLTIFVQVQNTIVIQRWILVLGDDGGIA